MEALPQIGDSLSAYIPACQLEERLAQCVSRMEAELAARRGRLAGALQAGGSGGSGHTSQDSGAFKFQWSKEVQVGAVRQ